MFTKTTVENYKGFSKSEIPVKPITLLMGQNNSGKTSIIQFLLGLYQSNSDKSYHPTEFVHNGSVVNFGRLENLWRGKNLNNPLKFEFEFQSVDLKEKLQSSFFEEFRTDLFGTAVNVLTMADFFLDSSEAQFARTEVLSAAEDARRKLDNQEEDNTESKIPENIIQPLYKLKALLRKYGGDSKFRSVRTSRGYYRSASVLESGSESDSTTLFEYLRALKRSKFTEQFTLDYEIAKGGKNTIIVRRMSIRRRKDKKCILSLQIDSEFKGSPFTNVQSDFYDGNMGSLASSIRTAPRTRTNATSTFTSRWMGRLGDVDVGSFADLVREVFGLSQEECFGSQFSTSFAHIPPLRARPRRYYLPEVLNATIDQQALFEGLTSISTKKAINEWLKEFDVEIDVAEVEQVIKKIVVTPSHSDDLTLEIADVGFGFSQILPVISALLMSRDDSLILIEQPEVHLHPDMQAAFGDLLVKLLSHSKKKERRTFVVETHSEYLLTELRAQIATGALDEDDLCVLYFSRDKNGENAVREAKLTRDGGIKWPSKFINRHFSNQRKIIESQIKAKPQNQEDKN